jgi:hypothetical protein
MVPGPAPPRQVRTSTCFAPDLSQIDFDLQPMWSDRLRQRVRLAARER